MPSAWYASHQRDVALHERRKAFLGRSRVGPLAGAFTLIGVCVVLTALMFAAIAHVGSDVQATPSLTAVPRGSGLQVVHSDPLELERVHAFLSVPGRVFLNGAPGTPVAPAGAPLGTQGTLTGGDSLRVCTDLPALRVELALMDRSSGAVLGRHTFSSPPLCGP